MPAFVNYRYFWALSITRMVFSGTYTSTYNPGTPAYVIFDTGMTNFNRFILILMLSCKAVLSI